MTIKGQNKHIETLQEEENWKSKLKQIVTNNSIGKIKWITCKKDENATEKEKIREQKQCWEIKNMVVETT